MMGPRRSGSPIRVLVSIGTRPEVIKLAPVVRALRRDPLFRVRILATGQHRELLAQLLGFFRLTPDADLGLMREDQSLADLTGRMVGAVDRVLAEENPDLVLAQGDTTTVMVTALCSFYRRIAFGHVEAGLRTRRKFSPFPEEMNRAITARLGDLHFAPTETARANLLREGIPDSRIFVTGNTVIDALLWAAPRVDETPWLSGDGRRLILVTAHRRENFGEPLREICEALEELATRPDVRILYPVHPNPSISGPVHRMLAGSPGVSLVEPLDYPEFIAALKASALVLTDSGGVQEEAPSLGKPVLVLRRDTERPEGIDAGNAFLVGTRRESIVERARALLEDPDLYARVARSSNPYGDGRAAERIHRAITSFFEARSSEG